MKTNRKVVALGTSILAAASVITALACWEQYPYICIDYLQVGPCEPWTGTIYYHQDVSQGQCFRTMVLDNAQTGGNDKSPPVVNQCIEPTIVGLYLNTKCDGDPVRTTTGHVYANCTDQFINDEHCDETGG